MQLTQSEAENILSRVFSQELEGGRVSIVDNPANPTNPNVPGPGVKISATTFDRVLRLLAGDPRFKIDAIKLYREAVPGTGLGEAKAYVERIAGTP
jgi:ribosomal protein L7/L12